MHLMNYPSVFDQLWNQFIDFSPRYAVEGETYFSPRVDIENNKDSVVLSAELPGIPKDSVAVEINDRTLVIKGEKKAEHQAQEQGVYRSERAYGAFERQFTLSKHLDLERIDARFTDGVLTLTIPKRPEATPRQIDIQVGKSGQKQIDSKSAAA